ncbi:Derlin [Cynara cardunculus var. scolymus]|uniref:Derlin n=1 Tax=Cynara cardunculus var. scolymus TaxID=59895 RepID=A0A118JX34_CYNCS|nr:Derlin [Cynara cardunculus var. scolymus]
MAQVVEEWYKQMPVITRSYLTAAVLTTVGCSLEIISPYNLYLNPRLVIKQYQIWRLITNFLYFRKMGKHSTHAWGRTADFFYMLLFGATILTGIVLVGGMIPYVSESFAKIIFLSNSLTFMMVYVWSKRNPFIHMSFLGLFTFTAAYLPWVSSSCQYFTNITCFVGLLCSCWCKCLGRSTCKSLGMVAGHAYYFLEDVYPRMSGRRPLKTPSFIKSLFGTEPVVVARPGDVIFAAPPMDEMRR